MNERTASLLWGVIGLFAGIAIGATTLFGIHLAAASGGGLFGEELRFWALFPRTYGVVKGTPVRLNGIEAGEVTAVEIVSTEEGEAMVAVGVLIRDAERLGPHVRTSSRVTIGAANLLGEKVLEISASGEGEPIAEGAQILGDPPLDLGDALDRVARILDGLGAAVDPAAGGADPRRILKDLQISMQNLREISNRVNRLLPR